MKKLNLLITSMLIASSFVFISCSKKSDSSTSSTPATVVAPTLSLTASTTSIAVGKTAKLYIQITKGDNNIQKLVIKRNDTILTDANKYTWDGTSSNKGYYNTANSTVKDSATVSFSYSGTSVFTAIAYDSQGNISATQTVTIVSLPVFSSVSTSILSQSIACFSSTSASTGTSCYSISNKTASRPSEASGVSNEIDFIYYYKSATSIAIYSPYYFKNNNIGSGTTGASAIAQFGTLNQTKFIAASSLDYDYATVSDVTSLANNATTGYIDGLKSGSVVVFKTASTSTTISKIGIFKVVSAPSNSNVVISLRVQK